jgi:proteasome beta subunit
MSLKQAVQFALRVLMIASEFDAATGGVNPETHTFATIKVLRHSGVETIAAEQQAEFLKA